jgi:demethylmenaquinone methyltransferase/2-methoxy-6-polyprenyl-1,4-benzoquinol methylase/phosphoethanolamine N-methyltransferase
MIQRDNGRKSSLTQCVTVAGVVAGGLLAYLAVRRLLSLRHGHRPAAPETEGIVIRWASLYDPFVEVLMRLLWREEGVEKGTLEHAQLTPGDRVLDVGCGTGSLALAAKAQVGPDGEVYGIDAAPEMIDVARRKAARAGVDVTFRVGLIEDIPFPDDQFTAVLSSLMVHHLPGDELKHRAFAEIHRVLKPGGRLLVVDFEPPTGGLGKLLTALLLGHRMMENDVRRLPAMLEAAGFTQVEAGRTSLRVLSFVRGVAGEAGHG